MGAELPPLWRLLNADDVMGIGDTQCKAEYRPEGFKNEVWFCLLLKGHEEHSAWHACEPAWTVT